MTTWIFILPSSNALWISFSRCCSNNPTEVAERLCLFSRAWRRRLLIQQCLVGGSIPTDTSNRLRQDPTTSRGEQLVETSFRLTMRFVVRYAMHMSFCVCAILSMYVASASQFSGFDLTAVRLRPVVPRDWDCRIRSVLRPSAAPLPEQARLSSPSPAPSGR